MLLSKVADMTSYEVAEEYLKLSTPNVYAIDVEKLEAAEKAVDRHSSNAGKKRARFAKRRFYESDESDEDVLANEPIGLMKERAQGQALKRSGFGSIICYKCNRTGHIAANCPEA